mmetsp:Transcript_30455/g.74138  ORF Transcript_30455/g.74138 Transcript_30455/m.74138 type:complete len:297 (+) Transcript_30455:2897-3787(+)
MVAHAPVVWKSAGDLTFDVPGSGSLVLRADSDEDAAGTLLVSMYSNTTVKSEAVRAVELVAAELNLETGLHARDSNVTIHPSNYSTSVLSVGKHRGRLHLDDKELDMITITSSVTLGSTQTDVVWLDSVSYVETPQTVYVISMSRIEFIEGWSSFATNLELHADADIRINARVNVTGTVLAVADATCNHTGDFTITGSGALNASGHEVIVQSHDVHLANRLISGSKKTRFIGCRSVSIDVGGDGSGPGDMKIDRNELRLITATNLTLSSPSDRIRVSEVTARCNTSRTAPKTASAP